MRSLLPGFVLDLSFAFTGLMLHAHEPRVPKASTIRLAAAKMGPKDSLLE